ncbi:metal-dependent hydrolase [Paenibacillus aurantius]|uniref:Metal-dependent hydrolase n=1 Tax=Paenibacillus aurantius TaxID=2918900 RepID=A0AA96LGB2_9BACL|nr:metal-dependent hydrolase [Paenibacillus aurantius]WNQ13311.1 metal-dependent hydrolase [Paenibacillus aurantius]
MDTITHTLFGLTLYGTVDKSAMTKREKRALLFTAVAGSQIPDIDVISAWWDTGGRYQMWHRGITHSVFLVPVWAALLTAAVRLVGKVSGWRWFGLAALAVWIHDTSDLFNAWGTGYLEPFSSMRITFGTIPIVDPVYWLLMGAGALYANGKLRFRKRSGQPPDRSPAKPRVYRAVWLLIALYTALQSLQGAALYQKVKGNYEQTALSADFVPGVFTVIGKKGGVVELAKGSLWGGLKPAARLQSAEDADLDRLFEGNPKARTLYEWSPFVVIVDNGKELGVYDPRFYRNVQSFLFESIAK